MARAAFYVTTPIYYVNAAPHLGHAYTTIAADVLARHHRQRGDDVFFLTGTDEHGEPVALAAEREGVYAAGAGRPQRRALQGAAAAARRDATTSSSAPPTRGHVERVAGGPERVQDNGHVYEGDVRGLVLPALRGLQDRDRRSPRATPARSTTSRSIREQEQNWFFRLSAFQEPLEQLFTERPDFVAPRSRATTRRCAFIRGGPARRLALAREARLGHAGAVGSRTTSSTSGGTRCSTTTRRSRYAREGEDLTETFWPATYHLIGKDILKFHTVYWPALLMAAGLPAARAASSSTASC